MSTGAIASLLASRSAPASTKENSVFTKKWQIILAFVFGSAVTGAGAQSVTVIEYYNKPLDAYFITGRATEQQQLDAQVDFQRTGMSFQAVAAAGAPATATRICRFYISATSPFTSSHFYGREGTDCEYIRAQNLPGFTWEDYDFALDQPVGGVCAANAVTIYRGYRSAANGKTGNHRYSASAASYVAASNDGYAGEQAAFCATAATDVTPVVSADCGTFYYQGVRVGYQSLTGTGLPESWVRYHSGTMTTFNGQPAVPIVERYTSGTTSTLKKLMIQETADTWTDLGISTQDNGGTLEIYYTPPTVYPRRMTIGQRVEINRYAVYAPVQNFGSPSQIGYRMLVGREAVSVPAGTFDTCKFSSELTTQYAAIGRTDVARTTTWVAAGVGIVKSSTLETTAFGSDPPSVETSKEVLAVSVEPL